LRYDLFMDAARTIKFGSWQTGYNGSGATLDVPHNGSGSLTVYARLCASQQTAATGPYSGVFAANPSVTYAYDAGSTPCPVGSSPITGSFSVSATVVPKCNVSATSLNFGSAGFLASNVDATSSISVQCSNGLPYAVSLNGGNANASDLTQRKMSPGAATVTNGLYRDPSRILPWGGMIGINAQGGTGTGSTQTLTVCGRTPSQATPEPGSYSDAIVVTVTY
jgi:spore coat protein U-like protein